MIRKERCLVLDIDGTLCPIKKPHERYEDLPVIPEVVNRLREYRQQGFYIILYSARNMRTYEGNLGLIHANTARTLFDWLARHEIPYDEVHLGKPWPGKGGFYVDDKTVRPDEFSRLSYEEIQRLIGSE